MAALRNVFYDSNGIGQAGVLLSDGRIAAWGRSEFYALGVTGPSNPIYLTLANGRTAKSVAFERSNTAVVCDDGSIQVAGWNNTGSLGNGTSTQITTFTTVSLANSKLGKKAVFTTNGLYVLCTDGTVQAAGNNDWRIRSSNSKVLEHMSVFDGKTIVDIVASGTAITVLDSSDNIWIVGYIHPIINTSQTLQQLTLPEGNIPKQLFMGYRHIFVLCTNDNAFMLGHSENNIRGLPGTTSDFSNFTAVPMPSGKKPLWFAIGEMCTMMVTTDGKVYATGYNGYGQFGVGNTTEQANWAETTSLKAGRTPIAVYSNQRAFFLIYDDGSIQSAGLNFMGVLGDGTTTLRNVFTDVTTISGETIYSTTNSGIGVPNPTASDLNSGNVSKTSDVTITAGSRTITARKLTKSAGAVNYAPDAATKPSVAISNIPASVQDVTVGVAATDASGVAVVKIVAQDAENNLITDFSASPLTVRVTLPGFTSSMVTIQTSATIGGAVTDTITGYRVGTNLYEFTTTHLTYFSASAYVPCLVAGTRVLTAGGYKAVEELSAGDMIRTADNRIVPFRMFTTTISATSPETAPYTIPARTFGASPAKDLTVSPYHAIQSAPGVWQIPKYASRMFDGITQAPAGQPITYYHLELPNYFKDNLVVEGTVTESYGNRQTVGMKTVYKFNPGLNGFVRMQKMVTAKKSL
jgi:hypothetical protein